MKKTISFILLIFILFSVCSCGKAEIKTRKQVVPYSMSAFHTVVDMPSRILLVGAGGLYYYNKITGDSNRFCFNPLCRHRFSDGCNSARFFNQGDTSNSVVYDENTNRVYIARGQKIYSMAFDASDLKLECSLGESGDISELIYERYLIRNLQCVNGCLFFMYRDDQSGRDRVYKYDLTQRRLRALTSKDVWVMDFLVLEDYVFVKIMDSDEIIRFYTTDLDFTALDFCFDIGEFDVAETGVGVYNGEKLYSKSGDKIYEFDPLVKSKRILIEDEKIDTFLQTMAATEDGCYFVINDPKTIGKGAYGQDDVVTNYNTICLVSYDGKIKTVLDIPSFEIMSLNMVEGGVVVKCYAIYIGEDGALEQKANAFVLFDVADDGEFINPRPIGNYADDTELIEYLKGL